MTHRTGRRSARSSLLYPELPRGVLCHHERWTEAATRDTQGETDSPRSKSLAIADTFDAITQSRRTTKRAASPWQRRSFSRAGDAVRSGASGHFSPVPSDGSVEETFTAMQRLHSKHHRRDGKKIEGPVPASDSLADSGVARQPQGARADTRRDHCDSRSNSRDRTTHSRAVLRRLPTRQSALSQVAQILRSRSLSSVPLKRWRKNGPCRVIAPAEFATSASFRQIRDDEPSGAMRRIAAAGTSSTPR